MIPTGVGERISRGRKWAAVGVATLLLAISFWAIQFAVISWLGDASLEADAAIPPLTTVEILMFAGGVLAMGVGFAGLSLLSRRSRPLVGAALATLLGSAVALLLWFLLAYAGQFEPVTPMVGGFAVGGVVALRAEPEHALGRRVTAALLTIAYLFLLFRITPLIGAIVAPLLPLPALIWADALAERRAATRPTEEAMRQQGRRRAP